MAPTKTIKCDHCGHKGQSMVEEETSIITFFIFAMICFSTWEWILAINWLWYAFLLLFVLPILAGIFRI
jgi:hypothetical protein